MKRLVLPLSFMLSIVACLASCKAETGNLNNNQEMNNNTTNGNKVRIKVGESTFTATLFDNPTATAFKAFLPLSINMTELNTNEKFAQLPCRSGLINPRYSILLSIYYLRIVF